MAVHRSWLIKADPEFYSIDDLQRDKRTCWDGIRNYQARNFIRDDMKKGDLILVYHSGVEPKGIVGIARVCREAYPDHTALDPNHVHFDPKSTKAEPIWQMVDVEFVEKFPEIVTLAALKRVPAIQTMPLLQRGQRLSVMPIDPAHFEIVRKLGNS